MIPLGIHTHYSLMRSTIAVNALCRKARKLGYTSLGVTDTNNLYGLWPMLHACQQHGLSPIIGAEITDKAGRVFCLVKDATGYRNLCHLLTNRHCQPDFSLHRNLASGHEGLVLLATTESLLQHCVDLQADCGAALINRPDQRNSRLRRQASHCDIPAVAISDAFFLEPGEQTVQRLLRAIDTNTSISRLPARESAIETAYLASPAEYAERFQVWPEAIANTRLIAEKCTFRGPAFGLILPRYQSCTEQEACQLLRQAAYQGAEKRYAVPLPKAVTTRLEHELAIIATMGFSSYFLVVRDIVQPVSRTCGRGSGAASLVAYCLFITNVCPIKHNLYFERFLNPGRTDAPDIDIDFAWDERNQVLHTLLSTYGRHAAMVCNHVLLQPRMAIRETAKVFGMPSGEISSITKKLPWSWRIKTGDTGYLEYLHSLPQLRDVDFSGPWPQILQMAECICGTPRNLSVHPGGVIITPRPVSDYVPVQYTAKGVPVIQWEKDGTEEAGLVKIDLLGNRSLGVIRDTVTQVQKHRPDFDEQGWEPEDDPATRNTVAKGLTMGCFYIESPATRLLQKRSQRGDFEHLVIHSSIIRPAANEFIREYLRRLHGGAWHPVHPLIGNVLDETYGIMVYQEDVSRVAVRFGFSHVDGDRLRKILSKKDKQKKIVDFKQQFFSGAAERGVSPDRTEQIWGMMMSFDGYSFCKPHSASYARVSFQAAYLKTHFPAEFMSAVISNQGGFYSTFAYVSEARRLGLQVLPPHVNDSGPQWQGRGKELQVGLMAIRSLSRRTMERISREQPFTSIMDFLQRVQPEIDEATALIHCGALDNLETAEGRDNRGILCWLLGCWHRNRSTANRSLFLVAPKPPALPPEDRMQRLRNEYRVLGFLCSCHPITFFNAQRRQAGAIAAKDLPRYQGTGRRVIFLGWLITGKIVGTKHGEPMEFLTFEDETGLIECTLFPKVYHRYCHLLHNKGPLLLQGYVEEEFGACTLTVERVADRRTNFSLSGGTKQQLRLDLGLQKKYVRGGQRQNRGATASKHPEKSVAPAPVNGWRSALSR